MCNEYQGWSNYPTWIVANWIGNDAGAYDEVHDMADELAGGETPVADLADWLAEYVNEGITDELADELGTLYLDLLNSAVGLVNWHELAQEYINDNALARAS